MTGSRNTPSKAPEGSDAWVPEEPGAQLTGTVLEVDTAWSNWRADASSDPNAGWYPLLTIQQDDGEVVKLHGFRTVLYNELIKREPIPGERLTVTYVGEGKAPAEKGRNAAQIFRVTVEGRPPEAARSLYRQLSGTRRAPGQQPADAPAADGTPADGSDHPF